MTPEQINALERLEQAATLPPWRVCPDPDDTTTACVASADHDIDTGGDYHAIVCECYGFGNEIIGMKDGEQDAKLIAASRNALPALIRDWQIMRKALEKLASANAIRSEFATYISDVLKELDNEH